MRIECPCGFQGSVREQDTPVGIVGRCYGCDKLYSQKGEVMPDVPIFKNMDDAIKFYNKATSGKSESSTGKKPKGKRPSRNRKPAEKDQSATLIEDKPSLPIYKTIHFYLRPGPDSWPELLKDGRQEMEMSGAGTIVFCHQHYHGAECVSTCRSM